MMPIVVKGVFRVVYKQSGKVCYTLTDPTIPQLLGELDEETMGAFRIETTMDGASHQVLGCDPADGELTLLNLEDGSVCWVQEVGPQYRRGEAGLRCQNGVLYG
jgi:hypothetical protein